VTIWFARLRDALRGLERELLVLRVLRDAEVDAAERHVARLARGDRRVARHDEVRERLLVLGHIRVDEWVVDHERKVVRLGSRPCPCPPSAFEIEEVPALGRDSCITARGLNRRAVPARCCLAIDDLTAGRGHERVEPHDEALVRRPGHVLCRRSLGHPDHLVPGLRRSTFG